MWYSASLLFKGVHQTGEQGEPLWEESVRLIEAASDVEARAKAERIGSARRVSYRVEKGTLSWVFDRVERVFAIEGDSPVDGTEVFSRFLRDSEVKSLLTPFDDE